MISVWLREILYERFIRGIQGGYADEEGSLCGSRSAMVFSPHFDDETLGCGGTIIRKTRVGTRVQIVFMTDGSTSHRSLVSGETLTKMRSAEGVNAAINLGLKPDNVTLLGFKEGALASESERAAKRVSELIEEENPDEIFIPHRSEPLLWSADHRETTRIVKKALGLLGRNPIVLEYPVWYWYHWPWVGIDILEHNYRKVILKNTLSQLFGLRIGRDFNYGVRIGGVLAQKEKALEEHKSQMSRIIPDKEWITLRDISGGQFLECFFREYEIFLRYKFQG
ncbi:MAG: PIG-L deacetylase family protein [Nitrospirota bacterium]